MQAEAEGTFGLSQRVKFSGCESDLLPSSSVEMKNKWSYSFTFQTFTVLQGQRFNCLSQLT